MRIRKKTRQFAAAPGEKVYNVIDKNIEKDKVSNLSIGANALGHLMTAKSLMDGAAKDKEYTRELAIRGMKDNRNWFQRNAKALTATAGGTIGNVLGNYIQRKTGAKKLKGVGGFLLNSAIGMGASKIGSSLVDKPLDRMRQKRLEKHDAQYGSPYEKMYSQQPEEQQKKPNWVQRNKKLLIGAGITAGLGLGGYYLGKNVLAKKINKGGFIKDHIDNKSISNYLDSKGVHKWNKGMTSENYKKLRGEATDFLKKNKTYLDNRVKEKVAGYGLAAGLGLGAAGAMTLAAPSRQQHEEDTRSYARFQDTFRHIGNGVKLGIGGAVGSLSGFIADKLMEAYRKENK